ncbi:hypothetical protein ACFX2I_015981 [Malus domestica]
MNWVTPELSYAWLVGLGSSSSRGRPSSTRFSTNISILIFSCTVLLTLTPSSSCSSSWLQGSPPSKSSTPKGYPRPSVNRQQLAQWHPGIHAFDRFGRCVE